MGILETAPAPTPWAWMRFPGVSGPNGRSLVWKRKENTVLLVDERNEETPYLALAFYCYVKQVGRDQLLVWYHVGRTVKPDTVRMHLVESKNLSLIQRMPVYNRLMHDDASQISYEGARVTVDIPTGLSRGVHASVHFPDAMKAIQEIIIIAHGTDKPKRHLIGTAYHGESVYIVKPVANQIDVLPLDWWNNGEHDFGYEWIKRIVRDHETGKMVGDGARISPFLLDSNSGSFLQWITRPSAST